MAMDITQAECSANLNIGALVSNRLSLAQHKPRHQRGNPQINRKATPDDEARSTEAAQKQAKTKALWLGLAGAREPPTKAGDIGTKKIHKAQKGIETITTRKKGSRCTAAPHESSWKRWKET
ncbi:hypothetical protein H0G86_006018 [Trichoderma simmonsii]|uniref:Uncharacterized protein n=1 Tax=Trichoderma simmonsii TaxID=1491479 RepID=A0A8G0LDR1_9HYPO|nr:hypothetical protein H0G86_006018 [Trichoderma simmonsii]